MKMDDLNEALNKMEKEMYNKKEKNNNKTLIRIAFIIVAILILGLSFILLSTPTNASGHFEMEKDSTYQIPLEARCDVLMGNGVGSSGRSTNGVTSTCTMNGERFYADYIITNESNWHPYKHQYGCTNSIPQPVVNSCGYGLGQMNYSRIIGTPIETDFNLQIQQLNDYVKNRYGSWKGAYDFKIANGWY